MSDNEELAALRAERDKLLAFKQYVHDRLDAVGVSVDPDSPHKTEGCRIGGRLDELIGERDRLRAALKPFAEAVSSILPRDTVEGEPITPDTSLALYQSIWCGEGCSPTIGDCRRAAELLAATKAT